MVTVTAPAKLTVSLRMTGLREDGYHLIDAEMVSLDLADELVIEPVGGDRGEGIEVVLEGPAAGGLPVGPGPDNLVSRALAMVGRRAHVTLRKRIPAGAGLGGGSSDAAAVFRWAGRTAPADVAASARLGADVPFCIAGGRARVTGIGEVLEPLAFRPATYTLILPPFGVSTPAVYRAWDALSGPTGDHGNDLEPAALVVEPRLAEWRDRLGELTGCTPRLAGSGSTWFVEGDHPAPGLVVCRTVPAA